MMQRFPIFRSFTILVLFGLLLWAPLRLQGQGGWFDLTRHTEPLADLSHAQWRFHPGDDPAYAGPGFDDSSWPLLTADKPWDMQGFKGLSGFGWYRIHVKLNPGQPVMFALGSVYNDCEVFADGKRIALWGKMDEHPAPIYPHLWSVVATVPPHGGELVLAVRIWAWSKIAAREGGGFSGLHGVPVLLGSPEAVTSAVALHTNRYLVKASGEVLLGMLYVLAGLVALTLYVQARKSHEYLWFALFAVSSGLYPLFLLSASMWIPTWGTWFDSIETLLSDGTQIALILFFFRFIAEPVARPARWVIYFLCAELIVNQLNSFTHYLKFQSWMILSSLGTIVLFTAIVYLVFSYWRRSRATRRLGIPMLVLGVSKLVEAIGTLRLHFGRDPGSPPLMTEPLRITQTDIAELIFLLAIAYILTERFAETHAERTRLGNEFEAARTVQQVLIPDELPGVAGLTIESAYHPAQEVGGDFFQVLPLDDGAAFIVLGDVSGHGLKSAMTVSLIVGALRTYAEFYRSPAELLVGINRQLCGRGDGFATCIAMRIDAGGEVTLANAAHPNPYLNGQEVATDANLPLGVLLDVVYAETRLHLAAGDRLTLLTDGVIEATNPATRELFGFTRTAYISTHSAQAIADEAQYFGAGGPQGDDISVLTVVRV